jgi:hypothetical protein
MKHWLMLVIIRHPIRHSNIEHDCTLSNRNFILKIKKTQENPKNVLLASVVHGISCFFTIFISNLHAESKKKWLAPIRARFQHPVVEKSGKEQKVGMAPLPLFVLKFLAS